MSDAQSDSKLMALRGLAFDAAVQAKAFERRGPATLFPAQQATFLTQMALDVLTALGRGDKGAATECLVVLAAECRVMYESQDLPHVP